VAFLRKLCAHYGFEDFSQMECKPGKTLCWMRWEGSDPALPSVVLNSHMDVVPAFNADWIHDPWSATLDEEGWIHGRGTQDMKSVGIQYLAALGLLKGAGKRFARTIYCVFVPDEEIGGHDGMRLFCETEQFKAMNAAVVLDEGLASPSDRFTVFYGEREPWWIAVTATGPTVCAFPVDGRLVCSSTVSLS
jgi:aminoacylase